MCPPKDSLDDLRDLLADAGVLEEIEGDDFLPPEFMEDLDNDPIREEIKKVVKEKEDKNSKKVHVREKVKSETTLSEHNTKSIKDDRPVPGGGMDQLPKLTLDLSEDEMEAYLTIEQGAIQQFERDFLERLLKFRGIRFGINDAILDEIVENVGMGLPVVKELVARGNRPIMGKPSVVNIYFEKDDLLKVSHETQDGEKVDHRKRNRVNTVQEGTLIAERIPSVQGQDGVSVRGERISANKVNEAPLFAGKNTRMNDRGEIYSTTDGRPVIDRSGAVSVQEIFFVPGDLDMHIGDVEFRGDVHVSGNVLSGLSIKAGGDVYIKGFVEQSYIQAGGTLRINGGFTGGDKGLLKVGKDCHLSHVNGGEIRVEGDLNLKRELVNVTAWVQGNLNMLTSKSSIRGGDIYVRKELNGQNLGSTMGLPTYINVGPHEFWRDEIREIHKKFQEIRERLVLAKKGVSRITDRIAEDQEPEPKMKAIIDKLQGTVLRVENERRELLEKETELLSKINSYQPCVLRVQGKIHPGVRIKAGRVNHQVKEARSAVEFYENPKARKMEMRFIQTTKIL